jgi:1-phosphofructokinase
MALRATVACAHVPARVAIFGPHPLLSITIERRGDADDVHLHPGGQGVWVARTAGELGAEPVLCGFIGSEPGVPLRALLDRLAGERRLVETAGPTGCYVVDRRSGTRQTVASALSPPPSRHELDELVSVTVAAAGASSVLVVCNPLPADTLPLEVFGDLVGDVRENGTPVLVDLSSPRLDSALSGRPDVVKLNDWELAEYVVGPVGEPAELRAAVERLQQEGAGAVVVTRGERSALAFRGDQSWEITPPRFERGHREGCGDTMAGAMAAAWAAGEPWEEILRTGAAAGAAAFLRHGLGSVTADVVEELRAAVRVERLT